MKTLYEEDFEQWIEKQKEFLQSKNFSKLDIENLIEELDEMGTTEYDTLESHLANLLLHALKYNYYFYNSEDKWVKHSVIHLWKPSIIGARKEIRKVLKRKKSLKKRSTEALEIAYADAKESAIDQINDFVRSENKKINIESFPDKCPWNFEQILVKGWLPEEPIGENNE